MVGKELAEINLADITPGSQYGVGQARILDIRIGKAKQLLADGTQKISAVSEACGFSNPYHFCRAFKQRTGLTPSQYMQQNRLLFTDKP